MKMVRFLITTAFLMLSLTAGAQEFIIPEISKTKGNKTEASKPSSSPSATRKQPKKETIGPKSTRPKMSGATMHLTAPSDPTTGKEVEGLERSTSIKELEDRAAKGDIEAHTQLGMIYFGNDDKEALPHLQAGADAGDPLAQYFLGGVYYLGKFGVKADKAMAASYYLKAAQQGLAPAQYATAACLYKGEGVDQDKAAARSWMEKAAENEYDDAREFLQTHSFD